MRTYYVYIASNQWHSVIYTGVTNNIYRRMTEHRKKSEKSFTSKYNIDKLLFVEEFESIDEAIMAEKKIKGWRREKKMQLIKKVNPELKNLWDSSLRSECQNFMRKYKLVVFVPATHADKMREVLGQAGAGQMGNYDFASFSTKGIGRFRPLKGADPAIGEVGKMEAVEEERIETIVNADQLDMVMQAVLDNHPYEEPAIDVIELKNL